jgi:DNA-binding transcriptional MerR regulator
MAKSDKKSRRRARPSEAAPASKPDAKPAAKPDASAVASAEVGAAANASDLHLKQLRMKDLCDATGLGRQAIHFYIREGLLPEGQKTGRNMAYYSESHLERLRLIRRLQDEQFLPLKAIRAVLSAYDDDEAGSGLAAGDEAFSPAQQRFLHAVQQRLQGSLGAATPELTTTLGPLMARLAIDPRDLSDLVELGLLVVRPGPGSAGKRPAGKSKLLGPDSLVRQDDVWLLELLSGLRRLGLSRELGFLPADLTVVDDAVSALFRRETKLLRQRLAHLDADVAATLVEHALPIMNQLLVRLHEAKIRNFLAAL